MSDRASQLITTALDQLAAALAAGHSQALTALLKTMGRFHRYSVSNQILIAVQRPDATRVAGFRAWLALGRHVRRGEKGIAILAPMLRRQAPIDDLDETPVRRLTGFRTVFVFDLVQTEGEPLPSVATPTGDPGASIVRLEAFLATKNITCELVPRIPGSPTALGASYGGRIEVRDDLSPAETFTTLLHEAAHELLHQDGTVVRPPHVVRELEADAVACVVAEALGLEAIAATADYVHLHQGSVELLTASLGRIRRVAGELLEAVQDVLRNLSDDGTR